MKVIPAIDLLDGQVVRLHKGSYEDVTIYSSDPLDSVQKFKDSGFSHIHIIDLNGAKEGKFINLPHIQQAIQEHSVPVQTGGGVRTFKDVEQLVDAGLSGIICSSMAIKNEEDWLKALQEFPDKMILGMDLKDGKIAYSGWLETAKEDTFDFLQRMIKHGLKRVLSTDISKDGTLSGPNFELYRKLKKEFSNIEIIASGGVSNFEDLVKLKDIGVDGVVVGKAYYEGHLTLEEMKSINK